jgi:hypothetical protein
MVKHIVMWKLLDFAEGNTKEENIKIIREKLEGLKSIIPEISFLEVGTNFNPSGYDAVLNSEFNSPEELETYQNHPSHKEVSAFIAKVRIDRVVVDYIL